MRKDLLLMLILSLTLAAQGEKVAHSLKKTQDQKSEKLILINYDEDKVPSFRLPELMKSASNKKIVNSKEWMEIRRPELLEIFSSQVFGRVPVTPWQTSMKVTKVDANAMNGTATFKLVEIRIVAQSNSMTIHMGLFTPNKIKTPAPTFLLICNRDPKNIDFTRTIKREFWPAEEIVARGYAIAAFDNAEVDPDADDGFRNGIHGLLDQKRTDDSWGTIAAWAWGASRCLDYLITDKDVAVDKIAVVGHSRGAKTALWAGATDPRFAMVVCNEAGCVGSSLCRRSFGETIYEINRAFPHWFCTNFKNYSKNEEALPVDMHMLLSLTAPRPLYIASAANDLWGDPRGQYLALREALPAYNLFQTQSVLPLTMPLVNTPVQSGMVAYHIRDGKHDLLLKDWNYFMDYADIVLKTK